MKLILTVIGILLFIAICMASTIGRFAIIGIVIGFGILRDWGIDIKAWSQRSGGRAARAEHDENVTVLA